MAVTMQSRKATVSCAFCGTASRVDLARVHDRPKCGHCGKPMLLDRPIVVSDRDLERVVTGSEVPVLVDFYADWCGPCKVMAPVVDQLAAARQGSVLVAKLDTDRSQAIASKFDIRGIPTVIVFRDGKEVRRQSGALPLAALEAMLV